MNWPGPNHTLSLPDLPMDVTNVRALTPIEPELTQKEDALQLSLDRKPANDIASVIELTVSGRAFDIEPRAVKANRSLSFQKPARASNVYNDQESSYGPAKAVDGDRSTRWATDVEVKDPWIRIDLRTPTTINRVHIHEALGKRIQSHSLEYRNNGTWKTIYRGETVGSDFARTFDPVKTQAVRLNIHETTKGPTINEIQLYGPEK